MRKVVDVANTMKRPGKRTKDVESMFDICAVGERQRKKAFWSGRSLGAATLYNIGEIPSIPLARPQIYQLVKEWIKDGTLRLKVVKPPLTREQYDNQAYCILHKRNNHTTLDC
ncbi:hypothetical protein SESBI_11665 [Sesbania bispinosa]|nr:hypothetical protein SESBI_11665 [Sesbania bispinosa]